MCPRAAQVPTSRSSRSKRLGYTQLAVQMRSFRSPSTSCRSAASSCRCDERRASARAKTRAVLFLFEVGGGGELVALGKELVRLLFAGFVGRGKRGARRKPKCCLTGAPGSPAAIVHSAASPPFLGVRTFFGLCSKPGPLLSGFLF